MCICFIDKLDMVSIHALLLFKTIPTLIPGDQAEHPPPPTLIMFQYALVFNPLKL